MRDKNKLVYLIINIDRCWGCKTCEVACKQELNLGTGFSPIKIIETKIQNINNKKYKNFIPTLCLHCEKAYCLEACPVDAIYKEQDGTVQVNKKKCIGCGICESACPYGMIKIVNSDYPIKCSMCINRRKDGRLPSCLQHCIGKVFSIIKEDSLDNAIKNKYNWKTGQVVYISSQWSELGKNICRLNFLRHKV